MICMFAFCCHIIPNTIQKSGKMSATDLFCNCTSRSTAVIGNALKLKELGIEIEAELEIDMGAATSRAVALGAVASRTTSGAGLDNRMLLHFLFRGESLNWFREL